MLIFTLNIKGGINLAVIALELSYPNISAIVIEKKSE